MEQLKSSENYRQTFTKLVLPNSDFIDFIFEECVFLTCNFSGANFKRARFLGCRFESSDLSNAKLDNTRIRNTEFDKCKLLGLQWTQMEDFTDPVFRECILSFSNFSGMKLKKAQFYQSTLRDVDFSGADLPESNFKDCDLLNARFSATCLLKSDFRGAINYLISPIENKLRGARFSLPEAQGLLYGLGILLDEESRNVVSKEVRHGH